MHYHFANTRVADTHIANMRGADIRVLTNPVTQNGFFQNRLLRLMSVSTLNASLCLNLCACSTTSETFDCKAGKGVGCKSISEVNRMVDSDTRVQGGLEENEVKKDKQSMLLPLETASPSSSIMPTGSLAVEREKILSQHSEIPLSDTITVHRVQEEHLRVWIAPFQDEQGNLHEGSVVHTVFKPGYWQLRSVPQRVSDPRASNSRVSDPSINDSKSIGLEEDD